MSLNRCAIPALTVAVLVFGCGGGEPEEPATAEPVAGTATASLPVSEPAGPVDEALAERGETLFQSKGCIACHTFGGGRLTGPDLAGVTERRSFEWIYHQIMSPDSMTANDPVARQLMAEYMTQMPNLALQPEEVLALYEYLREQEEELDEEETE